MRHPDHIGSKGKSYNLGSCSFWCDLGFSNCFQMTLNSGPIMRRQAFFCTYLEPRNGWLVTQNRSWSWIITVPALVVSICASGAGTHIHIPLQSVVPSAFEMIMVVELEHTLNRMFTLPSSPQPSSPDKIIIMLAFWISRYYSALTPFVTLWTSVHRMFPITWITALVSPIPHACHGTM